MTQSTEVTISPRESVKAAEKVATTVNISAAASSTTGCGTMAVEVADSGIDRYVMLLKLKKTSMQATYGLTGVIT